MTNLIIRNNKANFSFIFKFQKTNNTYIHLNLIKGQNLKAIFMKNVSPNNHAVTGTYVGHHCGRECN